MLNEESVFAFETLDHLWTITPFKFRFGKSRVGNGDNILAIHKDVEFYFVFNGKEVCTVDNREYILENGGLLCINSYVPHSYYTSELSQYALLIISTDFLVSNGFDPTQVRFEEYIKDPKANEIIAKMVEEFKQTDDPLHTITMNSLILKFVAYIARNYSYEQKENEGIDSLKKISTTYKYVSLAMGYISENFKNYITLDELSTACGLSKYHFLRIFKLVTNMTPTNYINKIRCDCAKQLLLNGSSVTDAASASGFSDVHYFSNCFKKHKGVRPSELVKHPTKSKN